MNKKSVKVALVMFIAIVGCIFGFLLWMQKNLNKPKDNFNVPASEALFGCNYKKDLEPCASIIKSFPTENGCSAPGSWFKDEALILKCKEIYKRKVPSPVDELLKAIPAAVQQACKNSGGTLKTFPDGCADNCEKYQGPHVCTDMGVAACECGEARCWDGTTCIDYSGRE